MRTIQNRLTMTAIACSAVLALAACDSRNTDQPVSQPADATVDRTGPTVGERVDSAGADARPALEAAKEGVAAAVGTVADTARDAAITTQINADLARDPELSALQIDVDTNNGKVVLKGSAPNDTAKERAAAKALAVAGVTEVDNQLRVGS